MTAEKNPGAIHWTRARERTLLLTLAVIQFATIVDFLIILPLEPQYTRLYHISPQQFGLITAAYGISAGLAGLAAGFFLDRFDRKTALLWTYFGFALGTFLCGLSASFAQLVASRFFAGAFGGLLGAIVPAIVGDVVPMERRGAAMGLVMSAFSVASIVGVPIGIVVAARFNWHVPFIALAILCVCILPLAIWVTPPLRGHLAHVHEDHPVVRTWRVMTHPDHQKSFLFMAVITCAGFLVFPYMPAYMNFNVGFSEIQLAWIYVCGGAVTLYSMNWVGRWADRSGKRRVYNYVALSTALPLILVTTLPRVSMVLAVAVTTLLFVCMSARMVPAMAMMTAVVEARYRGGFMSINSAVQQLAMGIASLCGSLILGQTPKQELTHFGINGILAVILMYSSIYFAKFLKPAPEGEAVTEPVFMETV
jgi:MFS transporter, DHA1 family, inner membrane transport protein